MGSTTYQAVRRVAQRRVPAQVFETVLNMAALGGKILERPSFLLWGSPWTGYLTLVFLLVPPPL